MDRRMTVPPFVISTELEESVVVVNLSSKRYYILNQTAAFIWKGIASGKSKSEIVQEMLAEYDGAQDQVTAGVGRMFDAFLRAELIA